MYTALNYFKNQAKNKQVTLIINIKICEKKLYCKS